MPEEYSVKFIGEMEKVSFKPGDIAVLHCDRHLTIDARECIQKSWKSSAGDVPLFINDKGMRLGVLAAASGADALAASGDALERASTLVEAVLDAGLSPTSISVDLHTGAVSVLMPGRGDGKTPNRLQP